MESVNFVHDVNTLRKSIKSVYTTSEDLRSLNEELGGGPGNSRIQVLPVCWRHLLDFPKRREEKKHEQDLGMATNQEYEECEFTSNAMTISPLTKIRPLPGRSYDRRCWLRTITHFRSRTRRPAVPKCLSRTDLQHCVPGMQQDLQTLHREKPWLQRQGAPSWPFTWLSNPIRHSVPPAGEEKRANTFKESAPHVAS